MHEVTLTDTQKDIRRQTDMHRHRNLNKILQNRERPQKRDLSHFSMNGF